MGTASSEATDEPGAANAPPGAVPTSLLCCPPSPPLCGAENLPLCGDPIGGVADGAACDDPVGAEPDMPGAAEGKGA